MKIGSYLVYEHDRIKRRALKKLVTSLRSLFRPILFYLRREDVAVLRLVVLLLVFHLSTDVAI